MARKLFDREINDLIHSMTELGNKVDGRIQDDDRCPAYARYGKGEICGD